eukprot:6321582-Amphidinium_carterae.1
MTLSSFEQRLVSKTRQKVSFECHIFNNGGRVSRFCFAHSIHDNLVCIGKKRQSKDAKTTEFARMNVGFSEWVALDGDCVHGKAARLCLS